MEDVERIRELLEQRDRERHQFMLRLSAHLGAVQRRLLWLLAGLCAFAVAIFVLGAIVA